MTRPILGTTAAGPLVIDVERLLETRALLTASSGWGKSWALRRLLEQTHSRGAIQIVIDPEGEFASLRERFDFVIAGKGGDCPADPRAADLLARKLLELGSNAVLDLYELASDDRVRFVRRFLEALIDAPKALWRPALVVIDEAHMFAPETGSAESRDAVRGLMTRGRKRGFAGLLATQRLAKLDKDACDAGNVMVGRYTLDVDVQRAAGQLGLPKARHVEIQRLGRGEFFCYGPALSDELVRVQVGDVATTHPKSGQRAAAPPAPRGTVLKVLEQLRDLPAEAEEEARTSEELRARLRERERELAAARRGSADPEALARARSEGEAAGAAAARRAIASLATAASTKRERAARLIAKGREHLKLAGEAFAAAEDAEREPLDVPEIASPIQSRGTTAATAAPIRQLGEARRQPAPSKDAASLTARGGESRMLAILAQHYPSGVTIGQWAALAALKRSGGTWSTYLSRLRTRGQIEQRGDLWFATEAGVETAGVVPEQPSTPDELLAMWESKPGMGPAVRIVRVLLEHGGELASEDLAIAAGLTASGGTFSTYLSRARTAGLVVTTGGTVRVAETLR